jgi:hypothetical protein
MDGGCLLEPLRQVNRPIRSMKAIRALTELKKVVHGSLVATSCVQQVVKTIHP